MNNNNDNVRIQILYRRINCGRKSAENVVGGKYDNRPWARLANGGNGGGDAVHGSH